MLLSAHFSLTEFLSSSTADANGISNVPSNHYHYVNLARLALCLEYVRSIYRKPIYITSGYRCPELNNLISGASPTSKHMECLAVDLAYDYKLYTILRGLIGVSHNYGCITRVLDENFGSWIHMEINPF